MALGLRFASASPEHAGIPPVWALLVLSSVPCLVAAGRPGFRSVRSGAMVLACGGLALASGIHLGAGAADRARRSCVTTLQSGDAVTVSGRAREGARAGRNVRVTLQDARLERTGRADGCAVPRLVTYVAALEAPLAGGQHVSLRGEWVVLGRPGPWPRRPGRGAIVTGRQAEVTRPGGGDPRVWSPSAVLAVIRVRASERLRTRLPPDVEAVGRALVLAERDDVSASVRARFIDAGLAHLLAISGLHAGIVAALLSTVLGAFLPRVTALGAAAALVWAYVLAIGAPPSAVRAAFLIGGWAVARIRGRPARTWDLLGAAAVVALVADPLALSEPGLQLSFAGFTGLGAGLAIWERAVTGARARKLAARARRRGLSERGRRRFAAVAAASLAGAGAFAATAPIAAAHFQRLAPVAVVSHFGGAPLAGAAIASLALTLFLPGAAADLAADAAASILRALLWLAGAFARLPGGHASVTPPGPVTWVALALSAIAVTRFLRRGRPARAIVPLALAAALLLGGPAVSGWLERDRSLLCTVDVGQGDAAVLRTSRGRWIMFDAGPSFGRLDAGRDRILPLIRRHGGRSVDLFVLSHPDLDHLGGFGSVLSGMPVRRVLDTGDPLPRPGYLRFLARIEEEGVQWIRASEASSLRLDDVTLTVLGPRGESAGPRAAAPPSSTAGANETSLQLRVTLGGGFVYLNTGDATADDERVLLAAWPPDSLRADLLKVGHHGSRTSSDLAWLRAVRPGIAVISAGRGNAYGHPHPLVLERLRAAGVPRVWRTDREGTLCVDARPDGRWRISGERRWRVPSAMARVLTSQNREE